MPGRMHPGNNAKENVDAIGDGQRREPAESVSARMENHDEEEGYRTHVEKTQFESASCHAVGFA